MQLDLNTNIDNHLAGYRLARLEVFNWGTFHRKVWDINPSGSNALLTGDIGSGKSTLVDAITTLLVPHQKITYNKAAGADGRERSLKSYIKGAYKNEKVEQSSKARDVYLRNGQEHYTVLLAVFANAGTQHSVTLAQVFYLYNDQIRKYYVLAEQALSIVDHFSDFGNNINNLKRRLRKQPHTQVYDTFTDYNSRFRQHFGIKQPEALDLFHQTVSMKSVGNLTDFVREQMLGQTNIQEDIDKLVNRYQELSEAHQAVQRARDQHDLLQPLVEAADKRARIQTQIAEWEAVVEEIPRYFARLRVTALQQELTDRYRDWQQNETARQRLSQQVEEYRDDLIRQEAGLAGMSSNQRLESLRLQIKQTQQERDRQRGQATAYAELCTTLQEGTDAVWAPPSRATAFAENRQRATDTLVETNEALRELNRRKPALHIQLENERRQLAELQQELDSLRQRPTQIPERNMRLRARMLQALDLTATELPFAGELLQVRDNERTWEGAIERILHGLGLSLLVSEQHYQRVSDWVNRNHLDGKLVYLRTLPHRRVPNDDPSADSLVHKISIKADAAAYDWLANELRSRYDYTCCETMEDFRRATRAITPTGQSKSGRMQHTKDDRYKVNDRRRYVLGWSNAEKIATLESLYQEAATRKTEITTALHRLLSTEAALNERREQLQALLRFDRFADIDYGSTVSRITVLEREVAEITSASTELQTLQQRILELKQTIRQLEDQRTRLSENNGALTNQLLQAANSIYDSLSILDKIGPTIALRPDGRPVDAEKFYQVYSSIEVADEPVSDRLQQQLNKETISAQAKPGDLIRTQQRLITNISGKRGTIERRREEVSRVNTELTKRMSEFRNRYPEDTREVDNDLRSLPQFRELHQRLVQDDIPRHEERFRELLKQGAIRGILSFRTKLEDADRDIKEKIGRINEHLHDLDYNEATYISITHEAVHTDDIQEFKRDLKACLDHIYGADENIYTEEKFFQVKKLLDRFRGETEADLRWTRRVTDVRQWYTFGADERYREDDSSKEYFSDSAGKSGGQKEKLAYTILASAIAFQFGLEWGRSRDRSFRFVLIDEAFGRGSDESTRYGLQLFERLHLQLLIVTPLQKINVIEDYIEAVHYVSNPSGRESLVRNISKAEYLEEKMQHFTPQTAKTG